MVDRHLFDEVGDVVNGLAPTGLGELRTRAHRRGIKVWFGPSKPPKVHYEAQLIPRRFVDDLDGVALEVGFHAELPDEAANQSALDTLLGARKIWQADIGRQAEAGAFLGRESWRRLSEVWLEFDLDDPETPFEIGSRLVDYLELLEPIRNE